MGSATSLLKHGSVAGTGRSRRRWEMTKHVEIFWDGINWGGRRTKLEGNGRTPKILVFKANASNYFKY